jgi:hypothetical protein
MNKQHTQLLERLEDSASQVAEAAKKLSDEELQRIPKQGEWSLHMALAHLRDTEVEVYLYRIGRVLKEKEAPSVGSFDQEKWSAAHYSPKEPIADILREFRTGRRKLLNLLRQTTDKDWARYVIHPEYGKLSLEYMAMHTYNHTLEHLRQLLDVIEADELKKANR